MPTKAEFIDAMAKHLPPSASDLRLLDIGGVAGDELLERRPDLTIEVASLTTQHWNYPSESIDSVVAYDILLKPDLLENVLEIMRPGGRFIIVNPIGTVEETLVKTLENAGYIRILVEPAVSGSGVLIRGEKVHVTGDTLKRVGDVADRDADLLDLDNYRGRFVHLLIIQTPNIPVWKMKPEDEIKWNAIAVAAEGQTQVLAFSSLPKAVNFMQSAVLEGFIDGVNKVGKFSKETAKEWDFVTILNPLLFHIRNYDVVLIDIDKDSAEASDE